MSANTGIEWTDATWNPVVSGARRWKPIPGFPAYGASIDGQVISLKGSAPLILKQIIDKRRGNRRYVFLYSARAARGVKMWVHRIVLLAFGGPAPNDQQCRHLDGNPTHNHRSNLAWGSAQENTDDKRRHGTMPVGERSGTHKLTESDVLAIRREYGTTSLREMARRYGVSHTAVRRAAIGMKWGHITEGIRR